METIEEFAERLCPNKQVEYDMIISGAKWQQERMYSEEDMKEAFKNGAFKWRMHSAGKCFEEWFEQFKNK